MLPPCRAHPSEQLQQYPLPYQQQQQQQQQQQAGGFPELEALEAAFSRQQLQQAGSAAQHSTSAPAPAAWQVPALSLPGAAPPPRPGLTAAGGAGGDGEAAAAAAAEAKNMAAAAAAAAGGGGAQEQYVPEAAAVAWSHSRAWFGTDVELTTLAYEVRAEQPAWWMGQRRQMPSSKALCTCGVLAL